MWTVGILFCSHKIPRLPSLWVSGMTLSSYFPAVRSEHLENKFAYIGGPVDNFVPEMFSIPVAIWRRPRGGCGLEFQFRNDEQAPISMCSVSMRQARGNLDVIDISTSRARRSTSGPCFSAVFIDV